jgi:hypothetical protein
VVSQYDAKQKEKLVNRSGAAFRRRSDSAGARVFKGDQTLGKGLVFDKGEVALRGAGGEKRQALAERHGYDTKMEFVDEIVREEGAGQFPAPPMCQMFLPGRLERARRKDLGESLTKVTPWRSPGGCVREKT